MKDLREHAVHKATTDGEIEQRDISSYADAWSVVLNEKASDFALIVSVMCKSPVHSKARLGDVEWLVVPPMARGYYRIDGFTSPNCAIWAYMSEQALNSLITEGRAGRLQLRMADWTSGEIPVLVDVFQADVNDHSNLKQLLVQLGPTAEVLYFTQSGLTRGKLVQRIADLEEAR